MYVKKICADALHVALILAFVRIGPEILFNHRNDLEVGDILLGSTVGFRRHSLPNHNAITNRYVNLKALDSLILDRTSILRDQLSHLSNYGRNWNGIYAYYNQQNENPPTDSSNQAVDQNVLRNTSSNPERNVERPWEIWQSNNDIRRSSTTEAVENFQDISVAELSPEEMDLIEILWKQDIDLGVSREAYTYDSQLEKPQLNQEFSKTSEINVFVKASSDIKLEKNLSEEKLDSINQWDGLNYTIDSETGEHVLQVADKEDQNLPTEHTLLDDNCFENLSLSLFASENNNSEFDFNKVTVNDIDDDDNALPEPLEDFLLNLDALFAEVEKFEDDVTKEDEIGNYEESNEMYPSMEEYWQDIATTLPLSTVSGSYAGAGPIMPRAIRAYPIAPPTDLPADISSASSDFLSRATDIFPGPIIQPNTYSSRSHDFNGTFGYMPSLIGPTSLGCAVASSIATLTNDTDPAPDTSGILNGTYGLDLPPMLHPNQTSTITPVNDSLIPDLFMTEDLQLMHSTSVVSESVPNSDDVSRNTLPISAESMELSSDSIASSASGSIPYVSNYSDDPQANLSVPDIEYIEKDTLYATKYPFQQQYATSECRQTDLSYNHNYGLGASSCRNRNDFTHYLQHNHSYHLPFTNCNSPRKSTIKDKLKVERCDEDSYNRDERKAKALKVPMSIDDIINLGIEEFNERLAKFDLTEPQMTLIRDIRRRGKNKVAAQNCRKRKMDQISNLQQTLDFLETERLQLESERAQLLHQRRAVRDKYTQLCEFVFQSANHEPISSVFPSVIDNSNCTAFSNSTSSITESLKSEDTVFNQGVRVKKKMDKKRLNYP